ncbi:methyltransferase domain containing protein [Nitzschia inconspicua]|uniref:Methyltransferase domain containing protein n=1 Tax=Nitzschia inconspicua TaxID=303405 RepID=A0A9K3PVA7_9STRA|nr:methyltransferase domain containing protein [Nitzschia inconspicua]
MRAFDSQHWKNQQEICPNTQQLYASNTTALEELHRTIEEAVAFHTQGGSLKSIQRFLDSQIHPTLERLDITFQERKRQSKSAAQKTVKIDEDPKEFVRHYKVRRGGYGQPLPIEFIEKHPRTPTKDSLVDTVLHGSQREGKRWIDVMEIATPERFQVSLGPVGPSCPHMIHFSENEGLKEKSFCIADGSSAKQIDECHIFSIGSNDQWGFEMNVRKDLPQCHTHTFDCTLKVSPANQPRDDMVHFYPFCVSGDDSERKGGKQTSTLKGNYLPYMELWKAASITQPPKLLKMDVEGFEFDVLTSMLSSFETSKWWPEQIMMEVHFVTRMVDLEWMLRTRQSAELALFFGTLWNAGEYIPVKAQYFGKDCPSCMEVLLMRVRC